MKKNFFLPAFLLIAVCLFHSCKSLTNFSIEKRQHRSGYYVDWGNGKVKTDPANGASVKRADSKTKPTPASIAPEPKVKIKSAEAVQQPASGTAISTGTLKPAEKLTGHNSFRVKNEPMAQGKNLNRFEIQALNYFSDNFKAAASGETPEWVLAVLCIFVPPLAVYLSEGIGNPFWIDLILAILGLGIFSSGFFGLFWLAAVIYAFVIIF